MSNCKSRDTRLNKVLISLETLNLSPLAKVQYLDRMLTFAEVKPAAKAYCTKKVFQCLQLRFQTNKIKIQTNFFKNPDQIQTIFFENPDSVEKSRLSRTFTVKLTLADSFKRCQKKQISCIILAIL